MLNVKEVWLLAFNCIWLVIKYTVMVAVTVQILWELGKGVWQKLGGESWRL